MIAAISHHWRGPWVLSIHRLGDLFKIVTAIIVVIFVVLFNTFEGLRAVDREHIFAARLLGANKITVRVLLWRRRCSTGRSPR